MSESEVGDAHLFELGGNPPFSLYLRELWSRREFAVVVPASDIRAQNMDTVLGQLWHILNPAAMIGVYFLIFGVVLKTDRGVDNYLAFLVIGILMFQLSQRSVQDAVLSIARNEGLIRTLQFPRALLPISSVVGQSIAFVPAMGVLIGTILLTGATPTWRWLLFPAVLVAQFLIGLGGALLAARIGHQIRDLSQLLPHAFRLLFYMSGVLFSVEVFVDDIAIQRLFLLNPLYDVVTASRWALLGMPADPLLIWALLVWCLLLPTFGLIYFLGAERRYGS